MSSWLWSSTAPLQPQQRMLGAAANVLMKASQNFNGHGRVGIILRLRGPMISLEQLKKAVNRLQQRHPAMRSRLQMHPSVANTYILEEDANLQLQIEEIQRNREDHLNFWSAEWKQREKQPIHIGDPLIRFWISQDPEDSENLTAPREIVIVCEHAICDGISLSNAAHELLLILSDDDQTIPQGSLQWPITMEDAIQQSTTRFQRFRLITRLLLQFSYSYLTTKLPTFLLPFEAIDFPLNDIQNYSHTLLEYGHLDKDLTKQLIDKSREESVTVTASVMTALLLATYNMTKSDQRPDGLFKFASGADTRRRCLPPIASHDLAYHVSSIAIFEITRSTLSPILSKPWNLAKLIGCHLKSSVDSGQVLSCGLILSKFYELAMNSINLNQIPTCGISSWGILPFIEHYGSWKLEAMTPFVNMVRGTLPFMTIQTVNGELTIMFGATAPLISQTTIQRLRDETLMILQNMINRETSFEMQTQSCDHT